MTRPTVKVEIAFDGSTYIDVTLYSSGIQITRGRSRETDQYATGSASFTLRNEDRRFDPSNTAGLYYPNVEPGVPARISLDAVQVFGGFIDDLDVNYQQPQLCTVAVTCLDGFSLLAVAQLISYSPASQGTGARISSVLATVGYPGASSIATGQTTLQAGSFSSVAALDHIQTCARTENGFMFVSRTGLFTFFDRYKVSNETSQITFSDLGGTDVVYTKITQKSQALLLYNQVLGTRTGGSLQQANDSASQTQYHLRSLTLGQIENASDLDALALCQYIVSRYSQPDVRFDLLSVELSTFGSTTRAALEALDLVQLVTVKRTPPGSGAPTTITKLSVIDGISFSLDASAGTYLMTINLGSVDTRAYFRLDDPVFGLLDAGNKLGY
jgi:hypothetical protein